MFQPVYHTVNTSSTTSSNQYTTPSTHHLQPVPTSIPHRQHITYKQFQPVHHNVNTSPTRYIKTHHITTSSINLHRPNYFNPPDVTDHPLLTYIYITYVISTEIIILFNCYWLTATQLTTFAHLYSCNNNITLKMATLDAETCWWEHCEWNTALTFQNIYWLFIYYDTYFKAHKKRTKNPQR